MPPRLTSNELAADVAARMLSSVARFNREIVGLPLPSRPQVLDPSRLRWAMSALNEEISEFEEATENGDVAEAADALIDLVYFALGRLVEMGVPAKAVFDEVQQANMGKRRGELSKRPGSRGYDAVKPEGWQPPNHSWLLELDLDLIEDLQRRATLWDNVSPFLKEAVELRATKGNDYNTGNVLDDYFPLGHLSYFQMLLVKFLRVKSLLVLQSMGRPVNHDGLLDSVRDLSNYTTYYGERLLKRDLPQINDVTGMLKDAAS